MFPFDFFFQLCTLAAICDFKSACSSLSSCSFLSRSSFSWSWSSMRFCTRAARAARNAARSAVSVSWLSTRTLTLHDASERLEDLESPSSPKRLPNIESGVAAAVGAGVTNSSQPAGPVEATGAAVVAAAGGSGLNRKSAIPSSTAASTAGSTGTFASQEAGEDTSLDSAAGSVNGSKGDDRAWDGGFSPVSLLACESSPPRGGGDGAGGESDCREL
mmetsp:Transcript_6849/g.12411  ORF Transcript_6849/g.12411 Transcript_6849/m.12411 type:complete len:217 (-) Transcript_6849:670-1320(-)